MFCRCFGKTTPFGGPGSGLWPNGSAAHEAAARAAAPPVPAPGPQCRVAGFFADCFTGGNSGWTVLSSPGTVVFDGDKILEGSFGADPQGRAQKALPAVPVSAFTASFKFTEVNVPPTASQNYALGMFDSSGNAVLSIAFIGDGNGFAADRNNIYSITWTPSQGAEHAVVVTSDGSGNLVVTVDGAAIPLVLIAPGPVAGTPSVVEALITNNDLNGMGAFDEVFLTDGIVTGGLRFCCPEETP